MEHEVNLTEHNYYDQLLGLTISNALKIPFYRERWPLNVAQDIHSIGDLKHLPLLTKEEFQANVESRFPQSGKVALIHHSSGTTSSELLYRYRSQEEINFLSTFYGRELEMAGKDHISNSDRPIILVQQSDYHGNGIPLPTDSLVIRVAFDKQGLSHALDVIQRQFAIVGYSPMVEAIVGASEFVMMLTLALMKASLNPRELGIRSIHIISGFSSSKQRHFLHSAWNCPIVDTYSLSEVFGSAPSCSVCGRYNFRPTVLAEYLDPFSKTPVDEGIATLALTELYPFISYHPLIRYWTDDLVSVESSRCVACKSSKTFLPKGRLKHSLVDSETQPEKLLVAEFEYIDALAETPEIVYTASLGYRWLSDELDAVLMGNPRASLNLIRRSSTIKKIVLKFECVYSPVVYQEDARRVEGRLEERLLSKSPSLRGAIASGRYEFVVEACSRLRDFGT